MTIIAVMAAVVLIRLSDVSSDVHAEIRILKTHLRYVQSRAMADESSEWEVRFTPGSGGGYAVFVDGALSTQALPNESSATRSVPGSVALQISGGNTLAFDRWGSPGTTSRTVQLAQGGTSVQAVVTANTGFIP